ncbi:MAG TPA: M23 family metallopeptidase, partial [Rhizobiaceae bacterium]|nr:M23 family metallopeptidase [Rhizobiaceae bacterium]
SIATPSTNGRQFEFTQDSVNFPRSGDVAAMMATAGYDSQSARDAAAAIKSVLSTDKLNKGAHIRIGVESDGDVETVVRASVYSGKTHLVTVARTDAGVYQPSVEHVSLFDPSAGEAASTPVPIVSGRDLPTVYDAIWRAGLAYGMTDDMIGQTMRMLASDVDFQSRVHPADSLDVFFSLPENGDAPDADSEILYVRANFGGDTRKFYRFIAEDGSVDYFDGSGKSSRQFMLRNPVPAGKFRSPFGMRRHPILRYSRMHWGVDWAAPRGTPIIAPGNGVVEKAGWAQGYGKQTTIRHANGYVTSYSHQSNFAKGIRPGAKVRQGQVIGYIGTTGLSTGPHLHYEMEVNGRKVDPMRIRLPVGRVLKGAELAAFKKERDRIDALLANEMSTEVASR